LEDGDVIIVGTSFVTLMDAYVLIQAVGRSAGVSPALFGSVAKITIFRNDRVVTDTI
jgi:hypothetical protein